MAPAAPAAQRPGGTAATEDAAVTPSARPASPSRPAASTSPSQGSAEPVLPSLVAAGLPGEGQKKRGWTMFMNAPLQELKKEGESAEDPPSRPVASDPRGWTVPSTKGEAPEGSPNTDADPSSRASAVHGSVASEASGTASTARTVVPPGGSSPLAKTVVSTEAPASTTTTVPKTTVVAPELPSGSFAKHPEGPTLASSPSYGPRGDLRTPSATALQQQKPRSGKPIVLVVLGIAFVIGVLVTVAWVAIQ